MQVGQAGIGFADAEENLLGNAVPAQFDHGEVQFAGVFLRQPARQGGHAAATGDHLQHDVGGFDRLVPSGRDAGRCQEAGVDVEPVQRHRVGDQRFVGQLPGLHPVGATQGMGRTGDQHLFVVKDRLEEQSLAVQRVGCHQHVDLVAVQGADPAELEFLLDVDIHVRPRRQVRRHDLQQPLVTRVAFHADAQRAPFALGQLPQPCFRQFQLRQQAAGHGQQVFARLGRTQAAAFAQPDGHAQLFFQLAHGVAQGRLGQVQLVGGGGQRAVLFHRVDDCQVAAFQNGHGGSK